MTEVVAIFGLSATLALMACAFLIHDAVQQRHRVDRLEDIVRSIGMRVGSPSTDLPPIRDVADEYAPDAIIDDEAVRREWQLPRSWL